MSHSERTLCKTRTCDGSESSCQHLQCTRPRAPTRFQWQAHTCYSPLETCANRVCTEVCYVQKSNVRIINGINDASFRIVRYSRQHTLGGRVQPRKKTLAGCMLRNRTRCIELEDGGVASMVPLDRVCIQPPPPPRPNIFIST